MAKRRSLENSTTIATQSSYAPNGKYGINGKPYEQWAEEVMAAAAVKQLIDNQPQLKPMTMTKKDREIAKVKGDRNAEYERKQELQRKGVEALGILGTFARPSTWAALPFTGIEHFGEGFGTEWANTPLDLALPLAWQGAVNTANTAANAWRYRGFNAGNTPKGLLANAESLIARGVPEITAENATSITPEQWNAAYRAAYERGDKAEGQRLWSLWFKQKAPNNKVASGDGLPIRLRHNTDSKPWNVYDESFFDSQTGDGGWYGKGLYTTGNSWGKNAYGKNTMPLFVNMEKPAVIPPANISLNEIPDNFTTGYIARNFFNRSLSKEEYLRDPGQDFLELKEMYPELASKAVENTEKADGIIVQREAHGYLPFAPFEEVVLPKGTHIKSAEPFTLDANGNLIDLTERANFGKNDIRYSWLTPFLGLGTLGTMYGASNKRSLENNGYK